MENSIVFVDTIDTSKVVYIEEVHALLYQSVDRVVIVQEGLLLFMPLRFGGCQANVINPIRCRFESQHLDVFVSELMSQWIVTWYRIPCSWEIPENISINPCQIVERKLLDLVWILYSKQIIERELGLDDLALEISCKDPIDLVRKCITVIKLDISSKRILIRQFYNFDLEVVLIIDIVRNCIMICTPRILDLSRYCGVKHFIFLCVCIFKNFFEFLLEIRSHCMMALDSLLNFVHHILLLSYVKVLLPLESMMCLLKYMITMLKRHPFEPWHEFIYHFWYLVAVRYCSGVYLYVILADKALWGHVNILHI